MRKYWALLIIGVVCLWTCFTFSSCAPQKESELLKSYRKAAENGDADAQYNMSVCYYKMLTVDYNPAEGLKWLRKAAEQGHVEAQYRLGLLYSGGIGVTRDMDKAIEWMRKAAAQGHDGAQKCLKCYPSLK